MDGAWRSLVAHLHGVQGVAGSNPVAPTNLKNEVAAPPAFSEPLKTLRVPVLAPDWCHFFFSRSPHGIPAGSIRSHGDSAHYVQILALAIQVYAAVPVSRPKLSASAAVNVGRLPRWSAAPGPGLT